MKVIFRNVLSLSSDLLKKLLHKKLTSSDFNNFNNKINGIFRNVLNHV